MGGFANNAPIVTDGLVLYVDAGNDISYPGSGGTWSNLVGSNDGVFNGMDQSNNPSNNYDSANKGSIVFDGTDDYVNFSETLTLTEATFVAWIKRSGQQDSWAGILFSRGNGAGTLGLNYRSNTNQIGYHWYETWSSATSPSTYNWVSGLTPPDDEWCMAVISVSSTAVTAYLCQESGTTSATNSNSHPPATLGGCDIGRDPYTSARSMSGNCAIGQIYNRALTSTEVLQNYNALKNRFI